MPNPHCTVFISHGHRDAPAAREIDHLIEQAFEGRVLTFNTSRHDRGLNSGDRIDPRLLEELRECRVFLSLWTPSAVAQPAWMSWELGAAAASQGPAILTARALGVGVDALPLGLAARFTPDLGDVAEVKNLLRSIGAHVSDSFQPSTVEREFSRWDAEGVPSPLKAESVTGRVSITIHGSDRGLLENRTDRTLTEVEPVLVGDAAPAESARRLIEVLQHSLHHRREGATPSVMEPRGRLVFSLPAGFASGDSADLDLRWIAGTDGRQQQRLTVLFPSRGSVE